MKKLLPVLTVIFLLLVGRSGNIIAQVSPLTKSTAMKTMGYTLLNPGEKISIYKYYHAVHPPKEADRYPVKYYFAGPGNENLQELTLTNLKKTFPENHSFHDALDANFKEDKELISYDEFHKIYNINRLYGNSL